MSSLEGIGVGTVQFHVIGRIKPLSIMKQETRRMCMMGTRGRMGTMTKKGCYIRCEPSISVHTGPESYQKEYSRETGPNGSGAKIWGQPGVLTVF